MAIMNNEFSARFSEVASHMNSCNKVRIHYVYCITICHLSIKQSSAKMHEIDQCFKFIYVAIKHRNIWKTHYLLCIHSSTCSNIDSKWINIIHWQTDKHTHTNTHIMHKHTHTCMYTHTQKTHTSHTHTHTHTRTHTHTHTHIQTSSQNHF